MAAVKTLIKVVINSSTSRPTKLVQVFRQFSQHMLLSPTRPKRNSIIFNNVSHNICTLNLESLQSLTFMAHLTVKLLVSRTTGKIRGAFVRGIRSVAETTFLQKLRRFHPNVTSWGKKTYPSKTDHYNDYHCSNCHLLFTASYLTMGLDVLGFQSAVNTGFYRRSTLTGNGCKGSATATPPPT